MRKLALLLLLLSPLWATGAIANVSAGNGTCAQTNAATRSCVMTLTGTITAGDTELVVIVLPITTSRVASVVDNASPSSAVYTQRKVVSGSPPVRVEVWGTAVGGTLGGNQITITINTADSKIAAVAGEWSGVAAYGNINGSFSASLLANCSNAVQTQDNNNMVVELAGMQPITTATAGVGTLIGTISTDTTNEATAAIAQRLLGTIANQGPNISMSPNSTCTHAGFELRSSLPSGNVQVKHKVIQ